jgi:glycylpeptide N-tetradecanoyltransferase
VVEINFLCVHKKLRAKRLTPVLIKEITRRINLKGIFQATYTAGMRLPTPITTCNYVHRSLNPEKLVKIGFCGLRPGQTIEKLIKLNSLPQVFY